MNPLVSIVIPVYNLEEYIQSCIESLRRQTYQNLEIIVVNDGSTDNTLSTIKKLARNDGRIKCIDQKNQGVSVARNRGIEESRGDYFMFVDGDDVMKAQAVSLMVEAALETEADVVCAGIEKQIEYPSDDILLRDIRNINNARSVLSSDEALKELLYEKKITNGPFAKLFLTKKFKANRFPEGVSIAEDLYFNYRALLQARTVTLLYTKVYYYVLRQGSAMQTAFSSKKMDGLRILMQLSNERKPIWRALQTRIFMEAAYDLVQIYGTRCFSEEREACVNIISSNAWSVLKNKDAAIKNKIYALLFLVFGVQGGAGVLAARLKAKGKR
ncbi:MAG: glycosyltransferase family 2 protein [Alloprevotella tannerae]|nr:glycosyltransferase family 2 protein [Alloprevotella tannerae]